MQRILDVTLSLLALFFLSPILFTIMILLKFSGEKEVFYIQERVGLGGKTFGLIKFATMLKNSPNIGSKEITINNDPRVLPFGKLLRKSKINELPQLWNIVIGEMSIVGPRPMVSSTYINYSEQAQAILNTVRPGLTGLGSIIFRDEERFMSGHTDPVEFYTKNITPYKSDLEIWFVKNNGIRLYIKVIVITAWVILFPKSKVVNLAFKGLPKMPEIFI